MEERLYQQEVMREFALSDSRFWAMLWERQAGKSMTLADFALFEMLSRPNHTVIYASASLLLAQELPIKTAIRAQQSISQVVESDAVLLQQFADTAQITINAQNEDSPPPNPFSCLREYLNRLPVSPKCSRIRRKLKRNYRSLLNMPGTAPDFSPVLNTLKPDGSPVEFKTYDAGTDKEIIGGSGVNAKRISAASFAELFSQQRLEFRVYYDRTSYSRTKVIAPNIATARSWSGTVLLDEVAFIRNFKELVTALLPVISTDKNFKLILSTTPPEFDDTHYSFELLAPPSGLTFHSRPEGNWYTSEGGIRVHRADAFDTALAGKKIFDLKTGNEISPAEAFQRAPNKDGHRIAHWLTWMLGGSAACDLLRLRTAQERGGRQGAAAPLCQNFQIHSDADMVTGLNWLAGNLGGRTNDAPSPRPSPPMGARETARCKVALGFDVATTTKGKSNPSVVSIMEEHGPEWLVRAWFIWKTNDPVIANERLLSILTSIERCGIRPRALAQDATNERYYAEQNRRYFRSKLPVILIVASQAVDKPGLDKPTNWKEYLGQQLVAKLDDNNLTLPPDDYTRVDYRLVMKDRGKFVCEPNDQGMHGDCFDADKLAGHALTAVSNNRTIVAPMLGTMPPPFTFNSL